MEVSKGEVLTFTPRFECGDIETINRLLAEYKESVNRADEIAKQINELLSKTRVCLSVS